MKRQRSAILTILIVAGVFFINGVPGVSRVNAQNYSANKAPQAENLKLAQNSPTPALTDKSAPGARQLTQAKKTETETQSRVLRAREQYGQFPGLKSVGPYVLGPEDLIEITVWGNKELTSTMPVRPDGLISFPLVGDLRAQGLTPDQLRLALTQKLSNFITDPSVTVIVKAINSIHISIAGEVNAPGTYSANRPITLLHLFSTARGFTEKADLKRSYFLRDGKKLNIDFFKLVKEDDFTQNVWLKHNDLIFIHDNFVNRINIMGEVNNPQIINFQEGMTVLDAVLMANGLTEIARPTATQVYRRGKDADGKSEIQRMEIELDDVIFDGDLTKNILLKPGDIIHVPRSFF